MVKIKTKIVYILLFLGLFIGFIYLYYGMSSFELFTASIPNTPINISTQINIDPQSTYFIFNSTSQKITQIKVAGNVSSSGKYGSVIAYMPLSIYYTSPLINQPNLASTCTTDIGGNFSCIFDYNLPNHHFSSQQSAIPLQITGTLINPYPNTSIPITTQPFKPPGSPPIRAKPATAQPLINNQYGNKLIGANVNVYMKTQ